MAFCEDQTLQRDVYFNILFNTKNYKITRQDTFDIDISGKNRSNFY